MRKKAKSMELVTAPLTWSDFIRGKAVKGKGERRNTFSFWKKTFCFAKAFTKLLEKIIKNASQLPSDGKREEAILEMHSKASLLMESPIKRVYRNYRLRRCLQMKLAENRGDCEVAARNMVKMLGGVSVNVEPRSMEICSFCGSNPRGAMGEEEEPL